MNLYEILGVEPNANAAVIKRAFRKLAAKYHPDRAGGDEVKFKEIRRAYEILSDPELRKKYDTTGEIKEDTTDYEASAKQTLNNIFDLAILNNVSSNIVTWCEMNLKGSIAQVDEEISNQTVILNSLKKLKGRMKVKTGEDNAFEIILDSRIAATNEYLNGLEKGKKISNMAIEMLNGTYEYVAPTPSTATFDFALVRL